MLTIDNRGLRGGENPCELGIKTEEGKTTERKKEIKTGRSKLPYFKQ